MVIADEAVQSFYASLDYAKARNLALLHTGDLVDCVTEGNERFLAHHRRRELRRL